jgi:uncharacterized protein (TIGR04255 family)
MGRLVGPAARFGTVSGYTFDISTSDSTTEVWPNAPLALVAVEVRFPPETEGSWRVPVLRTIRDQLGKGWVLEGAQQQTVDVAVGPAGMQHANLKVENLTHIMSRDRTNSVTVRPESLTVETTRYQGYTAFRDLISASLTAAEQVLQPQGATRLGMRFIDEIRVPVLEGPNPWAPWMDSSLLAPRAAGLTTRSWTSAVQYDSGEDRHLVLRYGPSDGPVVSPPGPLKRPAPPPAGQIFVLDFDSYWQPDGIPAFSASELLEACDQLRRPVRELFDQLISAKLIAEVFRKGPAS